MRRSRIALHRRDANFSLLIPLPSSRSNYDCGGSRRGGYGLARLGYLHDTRSTSSVKHSARRRTTHANNNRTLAETKLGPQLMNARGRCRNRPLLDGPVAFVLKDVRERSGWGREMPEGEGLGVACCFGQQRDMATWIAAVAHVAVDAETKKITVKKIWQTIDCGTVVHPDGAMAQAEGG